jgi:hypothetical protein
MRGNVTVRLPEGLVVNPAAAGGLVACTPAEIGLHSGAPGGCPDASKIGSVEVKTPLLADALRGGLFLASQNDNPFGSLLAAYLVVEGHGVVIKLAGRLDADPVTGRLTAVFEGLPQQPVSDVKIDVAGGPRAALSTPSMCGVGAAESVLDGWNGKSVAVSTPYAVDCSAGVGGFSPSFTAGTLNNQAGAFSPFTVTFSRRDGEQSFAGLTVKAPPGSVTRARSQSSSRACGTSA